MLVAFGVYAVIALLLKSQPDVGMLAVITGVFFLQLFVGGLNLVLAGIGWPAWPAAGRRRLYLLPACAQPGDAVPATRTQGDNYQVTALAGGVRQWRLARASGRARDG